MSGIAVLMHDGFYGCGTGAGRANRAVLDVLVRRLPHLPVRVLPIRLRPESPEYDPDWHSTTRTLLGNRAVNPLDNGSGAMTRFGGLTHFRTACADAAARLARLKKSERPELILALDAPFHGLAALLPSDLAARTLTVPRSTARLHAPTEREGIAWEHAGLSALTARGGRIAAISTHMRHHLTSDYRIPASSVVDMPDGLLASERTPPAVMPALPDAARDGFLLAMGRATPYKGFEDLLEALALLRRSSTPVPHLLLAAVTETTAPTDYQHHLARRITALGIEATLHIRYDHCLPGLLAHPALRALIVPSRSEPFGRIPMEAFAAGAAPLVATTAGGLAETVREDESGCTAPPSDPAALAHAIGRALRTTPAQRAAMRTAGARILCERDYDRSVLAALGRIIPELVPTTA